MPWGIRIVLWGSMLMIISRVKRLYFMVNLDWPMRISIVKQVKLQVIENAFILNEQA